MVQWYKMSIRCVVGLELPYISDAQVIILISTGPTQILPSIKICVVLHLQKFKRGWEDIYFLCMCCITNSFIMNNF